MWVDRNMHEAYYVSIYVSMFIWYIVGPVSEELPTYDQQLSEFTCFNDKSTKLFNREGILRQQFIAEFIIVVLISETFVEENDVGCMSRQNACISNYASEKHKQKSV